MDNSEKFIANFHHLEGVTVGERKRNLYKILKSHKLDPVEVQRVIENLKPKSYLECLFQVDILIHLRRTVELLEVLRSGHEVFVCKIIKQRWFFKEAFGNITAEQFVNEILPTMSYSVKMKVLHQLALFLEPEFIDVIFDSVLKKYGLFIATNILNSCTTQKIENILKNNEIKLWSKDLKALHKKDSRLIRIYFEEMKGKEAEVICDNSFLTYLAQNDSMLFWDLMKTYEFKNDLKLGRRTTEKLIPSKKSDIVSDPKYYLKYLRSERVVRILNKQGCFMELYKHLFPCDPADVKDESVVTEILKYYPKYKRYDLFTKTFQDVFHEDIWCNPKCLDDYFLEFIPDESTREKWAQLRIKESNNLEYMKYYGIEHGITSVKERINLTSSKKQRSKLLLTLVECCGINRDTKALEQILEYLCERHRNEDVFVRHDLLSTVEKRFKDIELNKMHWKFLELNFTLQIDNACYFMDRFGNLILKYIKQLYENNDTEKCIDAIKKLMPSVIIYNYGLNLSKTLKNFELEKTILLHSYEVTVEKSRTTKDSEANHDISRIFYEIFQFNLRYPKHTILLSEDMKEALKDVVENGYPCYKFDIALSQIFCKLDRDDFENQLLDLYWKGIPEIFQLNTKIINWFLANDPMVLIHNFHIFKKSSYMLRTILPKFKLYSHLDLDNMAKRYCLDQLSTTEPKDHTDFIIPLSALSTSEEYIKIIEDGDYMPTISKLDITNQQSKDKYITQVYLIKNLRNTREPLKYLPVLMDKFCVGDFLQSSLPSLYKAFYRLPEDLLKSYLMLLSEKNNISVQKHALFLGCSVFDQVNANQILKSFDGTKNIALKKIVFSSALRYFSKNPTKDMFEIVISYMNFLTALDEENLQSLLTINIDSNYKALYMKHVWKLLDGFDRSSDIDNIISTYFKSCDKTYFKNVPNNFCKDIIHKYFIGGNNGHFETVDGINTFVVNFLICHNEDDDFSFVFKLLSNYKCEVWSNLNISKRKDIHNFFTTFCEQSCEVEVKFDTVNKFYKYWESTFSPADTFEIFLRLNLLQFWKKSDLRHFAEEIVKFAEKIVTDYGELSLSVFTTVFAEIINFKTDKERIDLLLDILNVPVSNLPFILVMNLIKIQGDFLYDNKVRKKYADVDGVLRESQDSIVKLYYNLLLAQQ